MWNSQSLNSHTCHDDCANAPSGTKCFINCKEYHECLEGLLIRVTCDANLVVDPDTLECALIPDVCPPCGTRDNCATQVPSTVATQVPSTVAVSPCDDCPNQPNGIRCFRDCNSYITCTNGQPQRVNCDTNDDMVVDPKTVRCEDIEEVCPPCGENDYEDECPQIHEDDFDINNLTGGQD
ncbi:unnamed protein product [Owenia fusiformis]|uniref:Uncharacterized protein n=1 Tax=Owenia fusiformis TaxID=6347 RepID=A0A8J1UV20_OWEFU|nr:unnamed protein product [Owenia fusiformis]